MEKLDNILKKLFGQINRKCKKLFVNLRIFLKFIILDTL